MGFHHDTPGNGLEGSWRPRFPGAVNRSLWSRLCKRRYTDNADSEPRPKGVVGEAHFVVRLSTLATTFANADHFASTSASGKPWECRSSTSSSFLAIVSRSSRDIMACRASTKGRRQQYFASS